MVDTYLTYALTPPPSLVLPVADPAPSLVLPVAALSLHREACPDQVQGVGGGDGGDACHGSGTQPPQGPLLAGVGRDVQELAGGEGAGSCLSELKLKTKAN